MSIKFENITEHTGVKIYNFDTSVDINKEDIKKIKQLMQDKHFICFKNQNLNEDSLIKFSRNFGNLKSYTEKNKTKKIFRFLM